MDELSALFRDPQVAQMAKQRLMEALQPPQDNQKERIAAGLRAAGKSLASTPGNFLAGAAAASGAGADAYSPLGGKPDTSRAKLAMDLLGQATNTKKAEDLMAYRESETARKTAADEARQAANNERIRLLEERLSITDAYNKGRLAQGGRGLDIREEQGDRRLDQGDERIRQGDERIADTKAYRDRMANISEKNADTARMNADRIRQGSKADPQKIQIDAAEHLRKARESIYKNINEYSSDEEKATAEAAFNDYTQQFTANLSAAAGSQEQQPQQITDKAQFDALPSGTRFIAPDGTIRIKP